MSSVPIGPLLGLPDDPREVELVHNLFVKTREGKVPWTKQGNAFTAALPNGLQVNFVLSPLISFIGAANWQLFTVRDKSQNELLRVNNGGGMVAVLAGKANLSPLVTATDDLFRAVVGIAGDDLTRAIDAIKKL